MKFIRWFLGKLILFFDAVFQPKSLERSEANQQAADRETQSLKLYQFEACPFCVKVRREIKRLGLKIETRDAKIPGPWREELEREGGRIKVPCLKIESDKPAQWMYESNDIIDYLQKRFAA